MDRCVGMRLAMMAVDDVEGFGAESYHVAPTNSFVTFMVVNLDVL